MEETRPLLILRLEGALQSWGEGAKWDLRDTAAMPTKSGIIGLLGCALGWPREDQRLVELSQAISLGVRADRPGVWMMDYQTITGDPLRNAEGKPRSLGNTFISRRGYLQDASFLAVIAGDRETIERLAAALRAPRWSVFLGRKNCVPSRPVLECVTEEYKDIPDALRRYPLAAHSTLPVSWECDVPGETQASYTRQDQCMPGYRQFARRRVWRGVWEGDGHVSD